ncbi:hypothetical protein P3W85_26775 [Cupriavidus basilensis]|uniref:Uncharacterized protein n=1 Tax=Cupriavidus basilensis TaxID=68895 RepID=A0ABT6AVB0_9BURK|nr:hypothetical protein [Cupriavidus basilensis]MDF3836530.1 hypothetical protein [Cupriavidus basilensis]
MPFIIAGLALIGALIYGAIQLYMTVSAALGAFAGAAAVLFCAAVLGGLMAGMVRRYRAIHGVTVKGERILSLARPWGSIRIDAEQKRGALDVGGAQARFIFADIESAEPLAKDGKWALGLHLAHHAQGDWHFPMKDRKEAQRWAKIFSLAATQKL